MLISIFIPPRLSNKKSELNKVLKSLANCGTLAIALAIINGLLNDQFIKLIADSCCSIADLVLNDIMFATDAFNQFIA